MKIRLRTNSFLLRRGLAEPVYVCFLCSLPRRCAPAALGTWPDGRRNPTVKVHEATVSPKT
eukprot:6196394-Pyramimonas_sp.AAC.1